MIHDPLSKPACHTTCNGGGLLLFSYTRDNIPVALSKSEAAGAGGALAPLPGYHLYIQVLGN